MPNLTDAMLEGSILFPAPLPSSADFVVSSRPADQELASGTTSATVDFAYATGEATSGTPVLTLLKPTGSGASGSVSNTGSVWRVSLSSLASGEGYGVILEYTSTSGQIARQACRVTVAATATYDWTLVKYLDLTQATTQTGLGTDGTYTAVVGADSLPLTVTHTNALDPTTTAALTNGSGLVVSCTAGSATAWNKMWSFKVSDLVGDLKIDSNLVRVEALISVTTLNGTSDLISFEIGDGLPVTAAYPMFGTALIKNGASDWRFRGTRRNAASATHTLGGTFSTTQPTDMHAEVYAFGMWSRVFGDAGTSWSSDAWTITGFASYLGQDAIAGAAFNPSFWSTTQYVVLMLAGSTVGTVAATLKGFKIYSASKRRT